MLPIINYRHLLRQMTYSSFNRQLLRTYYFQANHTLASWCKRSNCHLRTLLCMKRREKQPCSLGIQVIPTVIIQGINSGDRDCGKGHLVGPEEQSEHGPPPHSLTLTSLRLTESNCICYSLWKRRLDVLQFFVRNIESNLA